MPVKFNSFPYMVLFPPRRGFFFLSFFRQKGYGWTGSMRTEGSETPVTFKFHFPQYLSIIFIPLLFFVCVFPFRSLVIFFTRLVAAYLNQIMTYCDCSRRNSSMCFVILVAALCKDSRGLFFFVYSSVWHKDPTRSRLNSYMQTQYDI